MPRVRRHRTKYVWPRTLLLRRSRMQGRVDVCHRYVAALVPPRRLSQVHVQRHLLRPSHKRVPPHKVLEDSLKVCPPIARYRAVLTSMPASLCQWYLPGAADMYMRL